MINIQKTIGNNELNTKLKNRLNNKLKNKLSNILKLIFIIILVGNTYNIGFADGNNNNDLSEIKLTNGVKIINKYEDIDNIKTNNIKTIDEILNELKGNNITKIYDIDGSSFVLPEEIDDIMIEEIINKVAKLPLSDLITEKQEIIGTYYHGKTLRNIYSIPKWKYEMMDGVGLLDAQKIHYQIINNLECGDEFGYCIGGSIGPFQINKIHGNDWQKSYNLIKAKKYKELYKFQLQRTFDRLNSYKERMCNKKGPSENEIFRCMMKVHNGNNKPVAGTNLLFKDIYAMKGLEIKKILLEKIKE